MSAVVKLEAVIDAMDLPNEWESFLDPDTGEILTMTDEDRCALDEEEDGDETALGMPDWQRESFEKLRKLLDSGRGLALPGNFDIHEWDLMRRFATSIEDPDESAQLLGAIHGAGAFRLFKATIARFGLRDRWFEYRDHVVREMATDWLEANGIGYIEKGEQKK